MANDEIVNGPAAGQIPSRPRTVSQNDGKTVDFRRIIRQYLDNVRENFHGVYQRFVRGRCIS